MTDFRRRARRDVKASAKWTCILLLPAIIVTFAASAKLGGFHGGSGALPFEIAFAPFMALQALFGVYLPNNVFTWILAVVVEWSYLFLMVFVFRAVLHRAVAWLDKDAGV